MNILVTGGAGYKGIILTEKLLQAGYKVTVLDNFMYGYESIMHLALHPQLTIEKKDIRTGVDNIKDYDVIFHLAGISGFPACAANPHSAHLINVEATRQLADSLGKDQLLINASTTSLYGKSGKPCNEHTAVDPVSTYAMTKLAAEQIIHEKENVISLRFATIFGFSPKMRMDLMINDFTYKAIKEGVLVLFDSFAKRTFMHIQDAADCYLFTMEHADKMKGGIYNAGGNNLNFSKLDIAHLIREKVEYNIIDSEMKDKDLRHFIVDFNKIEKLGFVPKRSVEEGINELIKIFNFYEYYSHFKTI
ncbi:MAG: SDR family oxidoreductase [Bacteroidales bacterium]|nr:SDR family oxidoreductase [Bacteroidales bacterium]